MLLTFEQKLLTLSFVVLALVGQQDSCVASIVYSANFDGGTVSKIDNGNVSTFASGLNGPLGILVDPNGNVFVSSSVDGTVHKFSSSGTDLGIFAHITATNNFGDPIGAGGIAMDASGNMYVGESGFSTGDTNGDIHKYSPNGVEEPRVFAHMEFHAFPNFGTATYFGMSFDQSGNLWATNEFFSQVYKFSPQGATLLIENVGEAFGLAIAPSGDAYVGRYDGVIEKYSSTGVDLGAFASIGIGPTTTGLAFDANGTLYASFYETGEIHRFSPSGTDLGVFASGLGGPLGLAFAPVTAVPEPSSLTLFAIGTVAFFAMTARRR